MLVLIALLVILGSSLAAFARSTSNVASVDPLTTHFAYPDFILKTKLGSVAPNFSGFTPAQFNKAYGVNLLTNRGAGITVGIIDACGNPNAQTDLNKYDTTYGLPATTITVVKPQGTPCSDPNGWGVETDDPRILLCGAGALRGGGVSGIGGHNAAMAVLLGQVAVR